MNTSAVRLCLLEVLVLRSVRLDLHPDLVRVVGRGEPLVGKALSDVRVVPTGHLLDCAAGRVRRRGVTVGTVTGSEQSTGEQSPSHARSSPGPARIHPLTSFMGVKLHVLMAHGWSLPRMSKAGPDCLPVAARADASAGGAKPGATHTTGQAHPPPRAGARVDAARSHAVVSALLTLPSSATVTWTREVVMQGTGRKIVGSLLGGLLVVGLAIPAFAAQKDGFLYRIDCIQPSDPWVQARTSGTTQVKGPGQNFYREFVNGTQYQTRYMYGTYNGRYWHVTTPANLDSSNTRGICRNP